MARESGRRRVRRCRCARVAGRSADDGPRPGGNRAVHGEDHASVLERSGRIDALELEMEIVEADLGAEAPGVDERRPAFAERDREDLPVASDEVVIALEEGFPRRICWLLIHGAEYRHRPVRSPRQADAVAPGVERLVLGPDAVGFLARYAPPDS